MAATERTVNPGTWRRRLQAILAEIREGNDQDLPDESLWLEIGGTIEELRREWHRRSAKALIERVRACVPDNLTEEEINAFTDAAIAAARAERHARGV